MTKAKDNSIDDIAAAINDLATSIDERFNQVDERFNQVDARFNQVDEHFKQVDSRLSAIEIDVQDIRNEQRSMRQWLENIDNSVLGINSDIKEIYDRLLLLEKRGRQLSPEELREVENKLATIMQWAKKVSAVTGVSLPKM